MNASRLELMLERLNQLRNIGIRPTDDVVEQERIRIMNIIFLMNINTATLFMVIGLVTLEPAFLSFSIVGYLLSIIPLYLHSRHQILAARRFIFICISPMIAGILILCGSKIEVVHTFMLITIALMIFFSGWRSRVLFLTYNLICYIAAEWYLFNYQPILGDQINYWHGAIVFYSVLAPVLFLVNKFSSLSNTAEEQVNELFVAFNNSNRKIENNKQLIVQQNEQLQSTNKELERFMYVASHDLKAPLRSISSFVSLIKRKLKNHDDKDIHEYLEFTTNSAIQMQRLIDDILTFSRVGQNVVLENVDLNDILILVKNELSDKIKEKRVIIETANLPTILADKKLMQLLFFNLLDNAILYNTNSNPTIQIDYFLDNKKRYITITDNGIGIGEEHFERIFEMFKRLHTQVEYQGSGIGLAVCKKIVELNNGSIQVTSKVDKGSTFEIVI